MSVKRVLRIEDRGYVWHVPLETIAENYAKHYQDRGEDYQESYDYIMEDRHEGSEWYHNNMDFDDVASEAKLVATPIPLKAPRPGYAETYIITLLEK